MPDTLEPDTDETADDFENRIHAVSQSVWVCPNCERMAVFALGSNKARWFVREMPQPTPQPTDQT